MISWTKYLAFILFFLGWSACSSEGGEPQSEGDLQPGGEEFDLNPESEKKPIIKTIQFSQKASREYSKIVDVPVFEELETRFLQEGDAQPKIDILIMVDNSGSMREEQLALSQKMSALLSAITATDWRINIITTDNPCSSTADLPIGPNSFDYQEKYFVGINVGIGGSPNETGLETAAYNILEQPFSKGKVSCTPKPWLRTTEKAKLAVIFVSDENEDRSSTYDAESFLKVLEEDKGYILGDSAKLYGILNIGDGQCPSWEDPQIGHIYMEAIDLTDGIYGSICAADYSQTLSEISQDLSSLVKTEIPLKGVPRNVFKMKVTLDNVTFPNKWTVIDDLLVIEKPIPVGSELKALYKIEGLNSIELDEPANSDQINIEIADYTGRPIAWALSKDQQKLLFFEDLPEGKTVTVSYGDVKTGADYFSMPSKTRQVLSCSVGDKKRDFVYSRGQQSISFDPPLVSGDVGICQYEIAGEK